MGPLRQNVDRSKIFRVDEEEEEKEEEEEEEANNNKKKKKKKEENEKKRRKRNSRGNRCHLWGELVKNSSVNRN